MPPPSTEGPWRNSASWTDGTGALYPVLYHRHGGRLDERPIDPDPLLRFDTADVRAGVASVVDEALGSLASAS